MKPHDLSELTRELAALTPANRRERLIQYLESEPGAESDEAKPIWFDQLMEGACRMQMAHDAAQRFAAAARPTSLPLRLPSARLRRLRFRGEEKEARVLAENLPEEYLKERETLESPALRPSLHRVDPAWIPGAKRAWERATAVLDYEGEVDFLIDREDPGLSVRVLSCLDPLGRDDGENPCGAVFSPASLALPEPELTFLTGAALAEMLFDHAHYRSLRSDRPECGPLTILPPPVEAAWLRWRMKAPVSTDRAGLLACGSLGAGMRALLRSILGLPASALPTDDRTLVEKQGASLRDEFPSTLWMRLEAMRLFAKAFVAPSDEGEIGGLKLVDSEGSRETDRPKERSVDDAVEQLFPLRRPIADSPYADALAKALAAAGILVLAADGRLESVETRILIESLFLHFTDEPETLLQDASDDPAGQLDRVLEGLKPVAGEREAEWFLGRLVEVALADGRLLGFEAPVISRISEVLGLNAEEVARAIDRVTGRYREVALPHNVAAVALRG